MVAAIGELQEKAPAIIELALPALRDLLDTHVTAGYRLKRANSDTPELEYVKFHGAPCSGEEVAAAGYSFLTTLKAGRGFFDPLRPEKPQQNRVAALPFATWCSGEGPDDVARHLRSAAPRFGLSMDRIPDAARSIWSLEEAFSRLGMGKHDQLRVLVCDSDTLLTWVGAMQPVPFTHRQRLLLKRIAEPLRERLILERRTGEGRVGHAAMVAGLEHVPAAAFVLDATGRVLHANAVGRHRLEVQGSEIRLALARAARGQHTQSELVLTKLAGPGMPVRYLAICGTRGDRVRFGIERARQRWKLTSREVEVLAELAAGRTNRDISEKLGAAPRTVELHVSSLLHKAHCDSRSQLIIDLWHLAEAV